MTSHALFNNKEINLVCKIIGNQAALLTFSHTRSYGLTLATFKFINPERTQLSPQSTFCRIKVNEKLPEIMTLVCQLVKLMVGVLAVCQVCWSCSVVEWRPKTIAEQVGEAEIVVYGTVRAHYPMPDIPIERAYVAEMDLICNLKGEALPARINISEAGELTSCHHTLLPIRGEFITLLERDESGQLVPDEVNYLSVAFPPTRENARGVVKALGNLAERCPELHSLIGEPRDDGEGPEDSASGVSASLICFVVMLFTAIMF